MSTIQQDMYNGSHDIGQLQKTLAPVTSADLFKPQASLNLPRATFNTSNFLSYEARLRQPSSLKAGSAGLDRESISLATGRPHPSTYPFESMELGFLAPATTEGGVFTKQRYASLERVNPSDSIDLSIALSYGYSLGHEQLIQFLTTHISNVHKPLFSDWEVLLTCGNTSALEIAFRNFANPGEAILVEEYTYSGVIEAARPLRISLIPCHMDGNGICPVSLDSKLSNWSTYYPAKSKPRIMYTIPTGQNPSGVTQPLERRREILEVAEKHDLLIIEDDPYYYLQFMEQGLEHDYPLLPSYLSLCTSGRVVRLDTTSKILAPGLRLGWLTAPKSVVETFQASHDLGVVHPSGLSQAVVFKLLADVWGHDGFLHWLRQLSQSYLEKATIMQNALEACMKGMENVCTWIPTRAGMFFWLKINCAEHPDVRDALRQNLSPPLDDIEDEIHQRALDEGVVTCKGSFFRVQEDEHEVGGKTCIPEVHFRLTFATVKTLDIHPAIRILSKAIRASFSKD